ncbi:hypothetical protein KJY77_02370 [Canibacter sp. lx-72]|uniref:hypothetical protein n=1 Tax=Canibacter zhuwentaonis TaxID=2837491 RepID=UPI001BDCF812|nr:hypothetical protein [Canibacter zhuwentaonis]MBT1017988.1 hypothetical protein [Canibacter zhuwentaonis]MBT1035148.1 hypothetical protein [Canibacter zhuwentaonis]
MLHKLSPRRMLHNTAHLAWLMLALIEALERPSSTPSECIRLKKRGFRVHDTVLHLNTQPETSAHHSHDEMCRLFKFSAASLMSLLSYNPVSHALITDSVTQSILFLRQNPAHKSYIGYSNHDILRDEILLRITPIKPSEIIAVAL